jgi:nitrogen fixation NifU-like protein
MDEKLKQLYQGVILKHSRSPVNYEKKEDAAIKIEAYNPLCGDQFKLFMETEEDVVKSIHFHGYGCAISKASTSILVKKIEGKKIEEVEQLLQEYFDMLESGEAHPDEELEAFAAAKSFPGRMQCATLSWESLQKWLKEKDLP